MSSGGAGVHPRTVGVTGGIASGKSAVARLLEELGARTIDFDLLARHVVEPDKPAWREIVEEFGEQVLEDDRTIDRAALGDIVFADPEKRRQLEAMTHPRIREQYAREVAAICAEDPGAVIVAVVPLLIENNLQGMFDHLVVVHVPETTQIERLMRRDRLTREGAVARLRAQMPIDDKVAYADSTIDNSGTLDATRQQVVELWERLQQLWTESPGARSGCHGQT
jgi:dephospho-CoA kinase